MIRQMIRLTASSFAVLMIAAAGLCLTGCEEDDLAGTARGDAVVTSSANASAATPASSDAMGTAAKADAVAAKSPTAASTSKPTGIVDATFDDIKLDLEKDEPFADEKLTPEVEKFFGRRIRIRGYILPSFQQSGITQFVLVRDNQECCFGPGAALFDCIVVDMLPGRSADYTVRPVTVEGEFTLNPILDIEGKHLAIYHLAAETVE